MAFKARLGRVSGTLIDFSNADDCLPHNLLTAKLKNDGLDYNSQTLMLYYLTSRKKRAYFSSFIAIRRTFFGAYHKDQY